MAVEPGGLCEVGVRLDSPGTRHVVSELEAAQLARATVHVGGVRVVPGLGRDRQRCRSHVRQSRSVDRGAAHRHAGKFSDAERRQRVRREFTTVRDGSARARGPAKVELARFTDSRVASLASSIREPGSGASLTGDSRA